MSTRSENMSGFGYEETENTGSKDLYKVLIGAIAGAAAGSLIAGSFTQKGVELRNRVGESSKNMASNLTSNLKDKVSDISEVVADKFEAVKESAADLIEKGKEKIGRVSSSNAYSSNMAYTSAEETDGGGSGPQILLGALIVSVAATIVWSFATEKGNETRRRIAKSSKNMSGSFKDQVLSAAGDIKEVLTDVYESAKEGAADLIEQGEQRLKTS